MSSHVGVTSHRGSRKRQSAALRFAFVSLRTARVTYAVFMHLRQLTQAVQKETNV